MGCTHAANPTHLNTKQQSADQHQRAERGGKQPADHRRGLVVGLELVLDVGALRLVQVLLEKHLGLELVEHGACNAGRSVDGVVATVGWVGRDGGYEMSPSCSPAAPFTRNPW